MSGSVVWHSEREKVSFPNLGIHVMNDSSNFGSEIHGNRKNKDWRSTYCPKFRGISGGIRGVGSFIKSVHSDYRPSWRSHSVLPGRELINQ